MINKTRIILHGCMGNMCTAVSRLAKSDTSLNCEIVAGIDIVGSGDGLAFPVCPDLSLCDIDADVVIDCSVVESVPAVLEFGIKRNIPLVIGTTGLPKETKEAILSASEKLAILQSPNMSLGVNLLIGMVRQAAKLLTGFDVEIIEKHHKLKVDAPSGTAMILADTINQALGGEMDYIYNRSGERKKRASNEIGIHALRGGTIVGDHSVVFAGLDELIEFKHQVFSKEVFAMGMLRAARFLHVNEKPPGFYTMQDLMEV